MKTVDIFSPDNRTFKTFLKLTKTRGVKQHKMAILSGPKQTVEAARQFPDQCAGLLYPEDQSVPSAEVFGRLPQYRLATELFRQIDLFDTRRPLLAVSVPPFARLEETPWPPGCTLCIPFQDPANVGSAVRAAAAFEVSQVVILKEAAHPFHPKALRAAGSNIFRVRFVEGPGLDELAPAGIPLISLSPRGKDISEFRFPATFCLVPGLEGPGIPRGLAASAALAVSMRSGVESLNAAMATGIALYVWRQGRRKNKKAKPLGGNRNET